MSLDLLSFQTALVFRNLVPLSADLTGFASGVL